MDDDAIMTDLDKKGKKADFDSEMEVVKAKILEVKAKDSHNEARIQKRTSINQRDQFFDIRRQLLTEAARLKHEIMLLLGRYGHEELGVTVLNLSKEELSYQEALTVAGESVVVRQKNLAGFSVRETRCFVRSECVALWNNIENKVAKGHNLRVEGAEGVGKSTEIWAWALWKARRTKKTVIWFHIISINSIDAVRKTLIDGEANTVTSYTSQGAKIGTMISDSHGDMLVVDGGTQESYREIFPSCDRWRQNQKLRSYIIVSKVSIYISVRHDVAADIHKHKVPSWSFEEYTVACEDTAFYESVKENLQCGHADVLDKDELLKAKFYYAGGCAQWMFEFDFARMIADFNLHFRKISNYDEVFHNGHNDTKLYAVNHLRKHLRKERSQEYTYFCFYISHYALHRFSEKTQDKLKFIANAYKTAIGSGNQACIGWIVEYDLDYRLDECARINKSLAVTHVKTKEAKIEWQVSKKSTFVDESSVVLKVKEFFSNPKHTCKHLWLKPCRLNQPCYYDFLHFYYENEALCMHIVNATCARTHGLRLDILYKLGIKFLRAKFAIQSISFSFVFPHCASDTLPDWYTETSKMEMMENHSVNIVRLA